MRKLKQAEVKIVRDTLTKKQKGKCPLCSGSLAKKGAVLDHCHDKGTIRSSLCRNCNGMEGKVKTAAIRSATKEGMIEWLINLAQYWKYHDENPSTLVYPSHKSEDEKRLARNKKARVSRAKKA